VGCREGLSMETKRIQPPLPDKGADASDKDDDAHRVVHRTWKSDNEIMKKPK
ncbi:hypothetical protein H920_06004, partial [Fukomys damarensis]